MYDIIGIGELIVDIVNDNNNILKNPGGAPFNVIATCAINNLSTAYIGSIGNDNEGLIIKNTFSKLNINTEYLEINNNIKTVCALVTIKDNKDRTFKFIKNNNSFTSFSNTFNPIDCKVFHYGTLSLLNKSSYEYVSKYLDYCHMNNIPLAFDGNYRETEITKKDYITLIKRQLPILKYLKLSIEEAMIITSKKDINEIIDFLKSLTSSIILLSLGSDGAYLITKDYMIFEEALKVNAVDTTGAGDILFGTFLSLLIKNNLIEHLNKTNAIDLLSISVKTASISTTKFGAITSIPKLDIK